jgi:hypothetical protein
MFFDRNYEVCSGDGKRVFFKNRSYVYPDAWYNMTAGVFDKSLWTTEVPSITNVTYSADFLSKLENNERFDINIAVSDPQGDVTIDNVDSTVLFPNGYEATGGAGPINILNATDAVPDRYDLYTTQGYRGSSWPDSDPVTVRFAVEDQDGNISYADTELLEWMRGDVNRDYTINLSDAFSIIKILTNQVSNEKIFLQSDTNEDEILDLKDFIYIIQNSQ